MGNPCLITGCELFVPEEGKTLHGDLHHIGDCYVFNGVLNDKGETNWLPNYRGLQTTCHLIINPGEFYFERRGVVVVAKKASFLNEKAREYVGRWGD